jgi:hypothetical protein
MNPSIRLHSLVLLSSAAFLLGTSDAQGRRAYGVSSGRGSAVATPRGVAWSGENSSGAVTRRGGAVATDNGVAAANRRGVAVAGEDGAAVASRRGVAVAGENGAAVARRRGVAVAGDNGAAVAGARGVAVAGNNGVAVAGGVYPRPLPTGYVRFVPNGSRAVVYGGYSCFFVGGVYYRPVFYGGETVYVIVK